jgi:putative flavoprotein involved in K+ transport
MKTIGTVVIGGGQAGLAMSRCLLDRGHDHVVLERGRIAERWRSERWDSLRLLTPNWMTRLPGYAYQGPEPDGFMGRSDIIDYLVSYARSFDAPVEEETNVLSATQYDDGWRVETDRDMWLSRNVVIATGHCHTPHIPPFGSSLDPDILQMTTSRYRGPDDLPQGGVLVVGASASGVQLADELRRSGREVTLAVGRHNRLPREYRGWDIMWWLDRTGVLDRSIDDLPDPTEGMREPSLQLVGLRPMGSLDLGTLRDRGVRLVGRATSADGQTIALDRELAQDMLAADERLTRLLTRIDRYASLHGLEQHPAERFAAIDVPLDVPSTLDLRESGIQTVFWATGFRRHYPWLNAPVLDENGELQQHRGRTRLPGLYALGLQFMTRRRSSFIDGVGRDAEEIAEGIACKCEPQLAAA